jgi:plasminogen activator inhibitor 1 RNA-binding protein
MATLNPFELLGADENDDPTHLIAAAAAQKAEAKKASAAPAGKGTQPPSSAKLPTKPAPPAQAGELLWS